MPNIINMEKLKIGDNCIWGVSCSAVIWYDISLIHEFTPFIPSSMTAKLFHISMDLLLCLQWDTEAICGILWAGRRNLMQPVLASYLQVSFIFIPLMLVVVLWEAWLLPKHVDFLTPELTLSKICQWCKSTPSSNYQRKWNKHYNYWMFW